MDTSNDFQNLKITFNLSAPFIATRLTTISAILKKHFYDFSAKAGKKLPFTDKHENIHFIEKKEGIFSGSIWYIPKDADLHLGFHTKVSKPEIEKGKAHTNTKWSKNTLSKGWISDNEYILTPSIYFYIKANKEFVNSILTLAYNNDVLAIGKFTKQGFGTVDSFSIEEIAENKGFMLNETTCSKPLPIDSFNIKSKKIALHRPTAPYSKKEGKVHCYMPTTSYCESIDKSGSKKYKLSKKIPKHPVEFVQDLVKNKKYDENTHTFVEYDYEKTLKAKKKFINALTSENTTIKCSLLGTIEKEGVLGSDEKIIFNELEGKKSFSDFHYFSNTGFLSKKAIWAMHNVKSLGYTYASNNYLYQIRGQKADPEKTAKNLIFNPLELEPPFLLAEKTGINPRHMIFKGKMSVSNGFYYYQVMDKTLMIDSELLQEAIEKTKYALTNLKGVTKSHLCGLRDSSGSKYPSLAKENKNQENIEFIKNFHIRFDGDIKTLLSSISFDDKKTK